ncbi:flagellar biosynthetic protein FliQ [Buchnera aphidicola str. Bp (Baizongia pistaciae)]|uniref:Flagellar biosynthetic protein FliQ n=1 Tax=Buchnera aphidicola subsp. Baizongia pistaciae (strain Bp) TaxID=224915 RepID=FLIQ_BUCBP|nr:flagellar biosynthesis protein FliQ [Buchnera aphidicola]Q89AZ1.1 RecName: Full=Flagellar biosynthetic protein FliQ [Buchnera aphidicola str. Bp (Baizongia pistaciae)]AAO26813.1 flagellar biosynthetic protein FliQ [Buchnera aphidicola str. Bp (Baizongia pistaciae)]
MTIESVMSLFYDAMKVTLMISLPLLLSALCCGLIVSIFQAATQINEQTLSFIPKIAAVLVSIVIFGPWMLVILSDYTHTLFYNLSYITYS